MRESTAIQHNYLGYSPQSAVNRVIKDGSQFDSLFPKPDGKKVLLKKDGEVDETVQFMKQIVNDCNYQTKKIAEKIAVRKKDGSLDEKASVQSLWNFVVDYIKYNIEAGEQLRTPAKTWYDAQVCARQHPGVNDPQHSADCDCMSIFCGCVLLNWGIPFSFRITGYSDVLGICHGYQHVYTIAHCKGENVICDPVYHLFNAEKPFEIQKTYAMSLNGCDIYALSGIPDEDEDLGVTEYYETPDGSLGVLNGRAKRKARKAKRKAKKKARKAARKEKRAAKKEIKAARKAKRKARKRGDKKALAEAKEKLATAKAKKFNAKEKIRENRVGIAKVVSKVGQAIKKGTMFLPRAAFLMLLRLNFRGMARKFSNNQTAYNKFAGKWKRVFGGKEKKLKKAIEKGKKKKAFFGKGKNVNGLAGELYELGTILGRYGVISGRYISALAKRNQELNGGLGVEPVTMSIGAAITAALPIIQQCLDVFSSVKDLIPSNAQEAEEEGMASQEVDDDKYIAEDPDNMEEDDSEESEEEMEGFPLRGIEDGYYFIGDVAINGIPRTVICKKDECGNISVLGALNGKKKEARKAKKAAKKAAKAEKKAAKKAAKAEKKAAKKAAKAAKKKAKKEKKAAKKAAKAEKKAAKKEMKKAKKEAKKEAKKLGLSKKEAKKYVKEKKKEAKKEYKAKKKEIKATKKAAVKAAKTKKKEAKKAVKAAKKDYKAAKKDIKKTYKAAKKEAKQTFKQAKKDIKQQKKEKKAAKKAAKQQTTYDVDEPIKDYENNEVEVLDDDMNVVDTDMDMDNTVDSGVDNAEFDENFDNAENDISIEPNEDGEDFSDGSDDFADGGAENDSESGEDGDEDFFDSPEDAAAASGKKNKKRTASADSEDGEDSDGEDEETAEEKKKSSKKKLIIGGVVLAALGGLGFWLYKRKKQQPTASNTKSLKA